MRGAAIAGRQEAFVVTPRKSPLFTHPAVQADGLAVMVGSAGAATQNVVVRELGAHFPLPGPPRESRPTRLVHDRVTDDPASTADRLVPGDLLYFEPRRGVETST